MQYSKSYILSMEIKEALGHLYGEIEALEYKVEKLKRIIEDLEYERG